MVLRAAAEIATAVRRGAVPQDAAAAGPVLPQGAFLQVHPDAVGRVGAACLRGAVRVFVQRELRQDAAHRELRDARQSARRALQPLAAALLAWPVE